jgi:hypothetical protein
MCMTSTLNFIILNLRNDTKLKNLIYTQLKLIIKLINF